MGLQMRVPCIGITPCGQDAVHLPEFGTICVTRDMVKPALVITDLNAQFRIGFHIARPPTSLPGMVFDEK